MMITTSIDKEGRIILWKDDTMRYTGKKVSGGRRIALNGLRKLGRSSESSKLIKRMEKYEGNIPEGMDLT